MPDGLIHRFNVLLAEYGEHVDAAGGWVTATDPGWREDWTRRKDALFNEMVYVRWRQRFPSAPDDDPREGGPCRGDGCQTFAWYGYEGLCGWCWEVQHAQSA